MGHARHGEGPRRPRQQQPHLLMPRGPEIVAAEQHHTRARHVCGAHCLRIVHKHGAQCVCNTLAGAEEPQFDEEQPARLLYRGSSHQTSLASECQALACCSACLES